MEQSNNIVAGVDDQENNQDPTVIMMQIMAQQRYLYNNIMSAVGIQHWRSQKLAEMLLKQYDDAVWIRTLKILRGGRATLSTIWWHTINMGAENLERRQRCPDDIIIMHSMNTGAEDQKAGCPGNNMIGCSRSRVTYCVTARSTWPVTQAINVVCNNRTNVRVSPSCSLAIELRSK